MPCSPPDGPAIECLDREAGQKGSREGPGCYAGGEAQALQGARRGRRSRPGLLWCLGRACTCCCLRAPADCRRLARRRRPSPRSFCGRASARLRRLRRSVCSATRPASGALDGQPLPRGTAASASPDLLAAARSGPAEPMVQVAATDSGRVPTTAVASAGSCGRLFLSGLGSRARSSSHHRLRWACSCPGKAYLSAAIARQRPCDGHPAGSGR
mmetsp:Transcript_50944/g.110514  ORF Transcript_50944/g.110514 Transcript_50944/m.110514 type:complete len:213 (+) Transcript_50944:748-1386(+)